MLFGDRFASLKCIVAGDALSVQPTAPLLDRISLVQPVSISSCSQHGSVAMRTALRRLGVAERLATGARRQADSMSGPAAFNDVRWEHRLWYEGTGAAALACEWTKNRSASAEAFSVLELRWRRRRVAPRASPAFEPPEVGVAVAGRFAETTPVSSRAAAEVVALGFACAFDSKRGSGVPWHTPEAIAIWGPNYPQTALRYPKACPAQDRILRPYRLS